MSTKRKVYTAGFKAKIVLEVLEAEQTINEYPRVFSPLWSGHSK